MYICDSACTETFVHILILHYELFKHTVYLYGGNGSPNYG